MSSGEEQAPISLFYSYSHRDGELALKLKDHLDYLRQSGMISYWHDRDIDVGGDWEKEIDPHLWFADIILLLVSPSFIASDYCWSVEVSKALERHERGEATVIPVILRPCQWTITPFGKLQATPKDAKAVTDWLNQDSAFGDVASTIERVAHVLQERGPREPPANPAMMDAGEHKPPPELYEDEEPFYPARRQLDSLPPALASAITVRQDHSRQEQSHEYQRPIPKASPEILYPLSYRSRSTLFKMLVYAAIGALIAIGLGFVGVKVLTFFNTTRRMTPKGGSRGDPETYPAECSVFAPPGLPAGGTIMVQVFLHPPGLGDAAEKAASLFDTTAAPRGFTSLSLKLRKGVRVGFQLQAPDFCISDDGLGEISWHNRVAGLQFLVAASPSATGLSDRISILLLLGCAS